MIVLSSSLSDSRQVETEGGKVSICVKVNIGYQLPHIVIPKRQHRRLLTNIYNIHANRQQNFDMERNLDEGYEGVKELANTNHVIQTFKVV